MKTPSGNWMGSGNLEAIKSFASSIRTLSSSTGKKERVLGLTEAT